MNITKYDRIVKDKYTKNKSCVIDVYRVLIAFEVTDPAIQHAIKKLLCAGLRNKGSKLQDLTEAIISIKEAIAIHEAENTEEAE